jgi:hypothetical protein
MSKYIKSARGQMCQVRIPGVCNRNPETTVLAHLNGGGMGTKHFDIHGAYACSDCHAWLDGGYAKNSGRAVRDLAHLMGMQKTQAIMIEQGTLVL